jgi:hypothetical protein
MAITIRETIEQQIERQFPDQGFTRESIEKDFGKLVGTDDEPGALRRSRIDSFGQISDRGYWLSDVTDRSNFPRLVTDLDFGTSLFGLDPNSSAAQNQRDIRRRRISAAPFVASPARSELGSFRNRAINTDVFFNLSVEAQTKILETYYEVPGASMPSVTADLGYREAQGRVETVNGIISIARERLEVVFSERGVTTTPQGVVGALGVDINIANLFTRESVFAFRDRLESEIVETAINNFAWHYYIWYSSDNRASSTVQVPVTDLAERSKINDLAELFARARIHAFLVESFGGIASEQLAEIRGQEENIFPVASRISNREQRIILEDFESRRRQVLSDLEEAIENQPGLPPPPPAAEQARLRRFAEQCFLLDYLRDYAKINQTRNPDYTHPTTGRPDFHMLHGRTDTIVNKLVYNPQLALFDRITPSEFSGLVPTIRLYKVFSEINADGSRGEEYYQEIPFKDSVTEDEITSMVNSAFDRGQGVGLKSFDWKLEGENPFTARRDIFGELKLYFQSLDELANAQYSDGRIESKSFRYIDLVNIGLTPEAEGANLNFVWNPDYYKIKIEVGWADPTGTGVLSPQIEQAIEASRMTMFLSAIDHTININDQGNVDMSIEYIAYQEASYLDADSDILSDQETRNRRLTALKTIQDRRRQGCSADRLSKLRQEYTQIVRGENFRNWNRILQAMYDDNRIFYTMIDTDVLDRYINDGRTQFSQPLLERVFGASNPVNVQTSTTLESPPETSRAPSVLDGQQIPENEEQLRTALANLSYDADQDKHALQFFYFGDLLQMALKEVNTSTEATEEAISSRAKTDKDLQILLGPISYAETVGSDDDARTILLYDINLADIPISVNYYIDWFLGSVIAQERTIYPVLNFVRDVASNLISNMMRSQCHGLSNVERENLQLRTNFFAAKGEDPLNLAKNILPKRESSELAPAVPAAAAAGAVGGVAAAVATGGLLAAGGGVPIDGTETRIDVDKDFQSDSGVLPLIPPRRQQRATNYMLLYAMAPGTTEELKGNEFPITNPISDPGDRSRGIYHFGIAKDRGILQSIKFDKTDLAGLREARFENSFLNQLTGLAILSNVYDVEIKCAGNTMFYPGMKIYIDPRGLSPGIGNPAVQSSAASILGIGGYHTIFKVRSYIESGKFETTINAIYESSGQRLVSPGAQPGAENQEECDESVFDNVSLVREE